MLLVVVSFLGAGGVIGLIKLIFDERRARGRDPIDQDAADLQNEADGVRLAQLIRQVANETVEDMQRRIEELKAELAAEKKARQADVRRLSEQRQADIRRLTEDSKRFRRRVEDLLQAHNVPIPPWWSDPASGDAT